MYELMFWLLKSSYHKWAASSEFRTYRLCEQGRFRRACASAQSRQNLRCSLIQAVRQEEPSDRKPDPWPIWIAGHAQLKFVMTECSKTQIRLTGIKCKLPSFKVKMFETNNYCKHQPSLAAFNWISWCTSQTQMSLWIHETWFISLCG